MKILLIGPVPPHLGSNNPGGIAHHVWSLAVNLKDRGNEVAILAIGRYYETTRKKDGILIYGLEKNLSSFLKFVIRLPSLIAKMGKAPSQKTYIHALYSLFRVNAMDTLNTYDIVHIHGLHNTALSALEVLNIDVPRVVTVHSYNDFFPVLNNKQEKKITFINKYLNSADCLIHVSKADKLKGQELGVVFKGINKVIYNGVGVRVEENPSKRPNVCFVGTLIPTKRIYLFLMSVRYLNSSIQKINIAGDGPLRNQVESTARDIPLISYQGVIPNEEVRNMMGESSLLVVPSISESFGLVYIEALFEGCAVLGYGPIIEEFQEILKLNEIEKKLVVPVAPVDIEPRKLAEMINATFEFRLTEKGKETMKKIQHKAIDNFSWPSIIHKMEKMYEEVISQDIT